jgi:GNAT superfamily N-acetyltransferase
LIRHARPDELRFVWSSWSRSAQWPWGPGLAWSDAVNRLVEHLATPATTLVAQGQDGLVDGFAVLERPDVLHYLYVRLTARRQGVAMALLDALPRQAIRRYTERVTSKWMVERIPADWTYTPALLIRGNHGEARG